MTDESYNELIDKIKNLLLDNMYKTESDNSWNDYEYLSEERIRELMDGLYIPSRLNKLCDYEYSCGSYDGGYGVNCKSCKKKRKGEKMTDEMIYCQWVDETVAKEKLGEFCEEYIVDGRCIKCPTSDQIKLGMKPSELLRNISKG